MQLQTGNQAVQYKSYKAYVGKMQSQCLCAGEVLVILYWMAAAFAL